MGLGIGIGKMAMGGYRKKRPGGGSRNIRRWRGAALMAKAGGHGRRTAGQAGRWAGGVMRGSRTMPHAGEEWICRPERAEKKEKGGEGLTCAAGSSASQISISRPEYQHPNILLENLFMYYVEDDG